MLDDAAARQPGGAAVAPLLDVSGVTLQYKTKQYLVTATYRVDFKVYPADRFVLLGPSGCGKSTLLKGIGGFIKPVEGRIALTRLIQRAPRPELAGGRLSYRDNLVIRGLVALPVHL